MKEYPITFTTQVTNDITDIYNYIAINLKSPLTAERTIENFRKSISSLSILPERCPVLAGFMDGKVLIRKLKVGNYYILYRFFEETVTVVRILYGTSKIEELSQMIEG